MDQGTRPVVVSEKYRDDLQNIFQFGVETFGYDGAVIFYKNLDRLLVNLGTAYYIYPECRFLVTKSRMYRNIILESYLIIYRITNYRIEVLRVFHSSICTASRIRLVRKIKI